jgi:hypothetical protein
MNAEQLWETTMDPNYRTLRRVTIDSLAEADRVFSMLMGDECRQEENLLRKMQFTLTCLIFKGVLKQLKFKKITKLTNNRINLKL